MSQKHGRVTSAEQLQLQRAPTKTVSTPNPEEPLRVVGYVRVSTDKQAEKGIGLKVQRRKVRTYAELHDLELVELIEDDGHSAKSLDRPGIQRALQMLEQGEADALLVMKLDRLTRSVRDLGDLIDRFFLDGRHFLMSVEESVDTKSAAGRFMLGILSLVSQWEREVIAERTKAALQEKIRRGEYEPGRPPYGFKLENGRRVVVPEEQKIVRIVKLYRGKGWTLRRIAQLLTEQDYMNRKGRAFDPRQVSRMLGSKE